MGNVVHCVVGQGTGGTLKIKKKSSVRLKIYVTVGKFLANFSGFCPFSIKLVIYIHWINTC